MILRYALIVSTIILGIAILWRYVFTDPFSNEEDEVVAEFERWLPKVNLVTSGVKIRMTDYGIKGLFATRDLKQGHLIIDAPMESLIPENLESDDPIIQKAQKILSDNRLLGVILYQEAKRNNSKFAPYLNSLPTDFLTFALFLQPKELELINNTITYDLVDQHRRSIGNSYTQIISAIPELNFTKEEYFLYFAHALSRCLGIMINNRKVHTMVPVFDMMNAHSPERPDRHMVRTYFTTQGGPRIHVRTTKAIRAGEEIYNMYDPRFTNTDYLIDYGFVFPELNTVKLKFVFDYLEIDWNKNEKIAILRKIENVEVYNEQAHVFIKNSGNKAQYMSLYSAVRVIYYRTDGNMSKIDKDLTENKEKQVPFIDYYNEREAMKAIADYCAGKLKHFPSTTDQDELLLKIITPYTTRYNLIKLRNDERRVLNQLYTETYSRYKEMLKPE